MFFHELAHAAHARVETLTGGQDSQQEIIAESVAAALLSLYGYEPGHVTWSRDYIRSYASGKDAGAAALKVLADVDKVLRVIFHSEGS